MERFIEFGEDKAIMVNNADWLLKLNYVELLREVGSCFSVNKIQRIPIRIREWPQQSNRLSQWESSLFFKCFSLFLSVYIYLFIIHLFI